MLLACGRERKGVDAAAPEQDAGFFELVTLVDAGAEPRVSMDVDMPVGTCLAAQLDIAAEDTVQERRSTSTVKVVVDACIREVGPGLRTGELVVRSLESTLPDTDALARKATFGLGGWHELWWMNMAAESPREHVWRIDVDGLLRHLYLPRPTAPVGVGARWSWPFEVRVGYDVIEERREYEVTAITDEAVTLRVAGKRSSGNTAGSSSSEWTATVTVPRGGVAVPTMEGESRGQYHVFAGDVRGAQTGRFTLSPMK